MTKREAVILAGGFGPQLYEAIAFRKGGATADSIATLAQKYQANMYDIDLKGLSTT